MSGNDILGSVGLTLIILPVLTALGALIVHALAGAPFLVVAGVLTFLAGVVLTTLAVINS